jgi:hypothetical protein
MRHKPLPPLSEVESRLALSEKSPSGLVWTQKGTRGIKPGDAAGKQLPNKYWTVRFNEQSFYAHRLVYLLQTKEDPLEKEVDHVNGFEEPLNVRVATSRENNYNLSKRKNSKSKYKGVRAKRKKWQAGIHVEGVYKNLGVYKTELEAAQAYNEAALDLYGEFARINEL